MSGLRQKLSFNNGSKSAYVSFPDSGNTNKQNLEKTEKGSSVVGNGHQYAKSLPIVLVPKHIFMQEAGSSREIYQLFVLCEGGELSEYDKGSLSYNQKMDIAHDLSVV